MESVKTMLSRIVAVLAVAGGGFFTVSSTASAQQTQYTATH